MFENFDDESPIEFEWDSRKSGANLAKHGFDFEEASQIFYGPIFVRSSHRKALDRDRFFGWETGCSCICTKGRFHPDHLSATREEK
jgi:uncharacterized DUF497 family protein